MNVRRATEADLDTLHDLWREFQVEVPDPEWVDVTTIVDEDGVHQIAPRLKQAGAHGIVEYPLNKIID